jgi:hypothetical protein
MLGELLATRRIRSLAADDFQNLQKPLEHGDVSIGVLAYLSERVAEEPGERLPGQDDTLVP